jgi:hypothetical protein
LRASALNELGVFSRDEEVLDDLRSDLNVLEIKLRKIELYTILILLFTLFLGIPIGNKITSDQVVPRALALAEFLIQISVS